MLVILGNIFGLLSAISTALSVYTKNSRQMMAIQVAECSFSTLACLVLGGYCGAAMSFVVGTRCLVLALGKENKKFIILNIIFTLIIGAISIYFEQTIYSILPVIATVSYTLLIYNYKENYKVCKETVLFNTILWFIYNALILDYTEAVVEVILIINTVVAILKGEKK